MDTVQILTTTNLTTLGSGAAGVESLLSIITGALLPIESIATFMIVAANPKSPGAAVAAESAAPAALDGLAPASPASVAAGAPVVAEASVDENTTRVGCHFRMMSSFFCAAVGFL